MMELLKDTLDYAIFGVLGAMSVIALAYAIDGMLRYRRLQVGDFQHPEALELELRRGLVVIATVASNAPYVGLLGTVFGIMITFHDIGQSGQIDTHAVMVGLALALKATALGILVAIPSMMIYNALTARAERIKIHWQLAQHRVR